LRDLVHLEGGAIEETEAIPDLEPGHDEASSLRRPVQLCHMIDGWRVCRLGGWGRGELRYFVMAVRTPGAREWKNPQAGQRKGAELRGLQVFSSWKKAWARP
jgi:hypothetical protein